MCQHMKRVYTCGCDSFSVIPKGCMQVSVHVLNLPALGEQGKGKVFSVEDEAIIHTLF